MCGVFPHTLQGDKACVYDIVLHARPVLLVEALQLPTDMFKIFCSPSSIRDDIVANTHGVSRLSFGRVTATNLSWPCRVTTRSSIIPPSLFRRRLKELLYGPFTPFASLKAASSSGVARSDFSEVGSRCVRKSVAPGPDTLMDDKTLLVCLRWLAKRICTYDDWTMCDTSKIPACLRT